ncbi:MAG: nucleoside monophosphate kinase [Lentisphaerae bacterium]|nr:nucleoside monophosphate kinase [Lentisphaerota bacterium]
MNDALLLLGPTGAGKTPLGDYLAVHGLAGRRCVHFDFGAQLRRAAAADGHPALNAAQHRVVRDVLAAGALLEDAHFPIARAILLHVLRERRAGGRDLVVLNGLPRHAGQARGLEPLVAVRLVVLLECDAAVVRKRIRTNAGGDRGGRADDALAAVSARLDVYHARTRPLLDYYRRRGVACTEIRVTTESTPETLVSRLDSEIRSVFPA